EMEVLSKMTENKEAAGKRVFPRLAPAAAGALDLGGRVV
ncbi:unnamed protein product, partial [marine sediment metagenome]